MLSKKSCILQPNDNFNIDPDGIVSCFICNDGKSPNLFELRYIFIFYMNLNKQAM